MTRCPRCQRRFPPSGECPAHGKPTAVGEVQEAAELPNIAPPAGWTIGKRIAIGGTAVVYELAGGKPAVLKVARWRDRDIRARFEIESEVLRAVGPPSTPALIDHGTAGDWPYLIMEHVSGETLGTWMSRTGERGGLGEVIAILTRISMALGAVHDAGYVHRDLKPENISIGPRGIRLLDFGLAKALRGGGSGLTQAGAIVGTAHYSAPEQIRMGGAVDERADIYSLGVIAFEMLTGQPPFVGDRHAIEYQHQVARPPSVRDTREIPQELDELVLRCLSKQPDTRPHSTTELREALTRILTSAGTLRGVGGVTPSSPMKPLGRHSDVAIAWIAGGDPVAVVQAITGVHGMIVRQRGDGMLAAFSATEHERPLHTALEVCKELVHARCRVVIHAADALVRRTSQGKLMAYGKDLERVEDWIPATPFVGLVFTAAAAARLSVEGDPDLAGFFRERDIATANALHQPAPAFVGRTALVDRLVATLANPLLVAITGEEGSGKTRVLDEVIARLRAQGRDVIHVRARRRLPGDHADDERVLQALGGHDFGQALVAAITRRAVLVIDDVDRLSHPLAARLSSAMPLARIFTSSAPLFEVLDGDTARLAIELPPLSHADAGALLREQLRPARLIPDVLVERLALRGTGNPRLLLALARDMQRRGAIRRHAGSDEWYVAADELDTLLAPPGPAWFAMRALEDLPAELVSVLRACSALGPRFSMGEVAHVTGLANVADRLAVLARDGTVTERNGWYEIEDASLQQAIYDHMLDVRELVHTRALQYWLAHDTANHIGRLARIAYHAAGAGDHSTAAACWLTLAAAARRRGEIDQFELLHARVIASLAAKLPAHIRDLLEAVE